MTDRLTVEVGVSSSQAADVLDERLVESLVVHGLTEERATGQWDVAVRFVDDSEIQAMHLSFMALDTPTDILTFPYAVEPFDVGWGHLPDDALPQQGGDIVISVDSARDSAAEEGWTIDQELRFLVFHGVLHLVGWTDLEPAQRVRMLARQQELLDTFNVKQG